MQLLRLSRFLAFVYGSDSVDERAYRLIKKVALDTCYGWHREAFLTLMEYNDKGIELDEVMNKAHIEKTQTHRCLNDLLSLGAANRRKMTERQRRLTGHDTKGNIPYLWTLSDRAKKAVAQAKLKA
jgi:predicted transcriptional regulator